MNATANIVSTRSTSPRALHGRPHQINGYTLDRDSSITSFGAHKRCVVFGALDGSTVEVRVDDVPGDEDLPWPTVEQVMAVARHQTHRVHPKGSRLELVSQTEAGESAPRSKWLSFQVHGGR